jgi:hypothetical protein
VRRSAEPSIEALVIGAVVVFIFDSSRNPFHLTV